MFLVAVWLKLFHYLINDSLKIYMIIKLLPFVAQYIVHIVPISMDKADV